MKGIKYGISLNIMMSVDNSIRMHFIKQNDLEHYMHEIRMPFKNNPLIIIALFHEKLTSTLSSLPVLSSQYVCILVSPSMSTIYPLNTLYFLQGCNLASRHMML